MRTQSSLIAKWESEPQEQYRLLVRVSQDLNTAERNLQTRGIQVRRRCRLAQGLVITCTGEQALLLTQEEWVSSIEIDEPINTQSGSKPCL